ncbi:hypothetical protein H5410_024969 [Solanum commersonii]|uniref:Uncharacterized protein n=1 Tax=Solanum commersonii TaxID=4109 RepID=A0A9J5YUG1_SOLCO|nr:hypothetical protein H5410_024969 [Solanum commersonii]
MIFFAWDVIAGNRLSKIRMQDCICRATEVHPVALLLNQIFRGEYMFPYPEENAVLCWKNMVRLLLLLNITPAFRTVLQEVCIK